ncbi:SLC5 family protein [Pelagicoccus sp. SDUM812003]|uniref:SLC5 family protein n=1 Tax=Pelagicoccus sp. SDUM812003 TaxID=3041267 RepID=UPI00280C9574|nr:SLC5 family protein [Pelagicoccus sp. SDUM812003]MDQ8203744.1 SLC5 family protein [Pelagicoccus sp. SDUM812003]
MIQFLVFALITAAIAVLTYWKCRGARSSESGAKEYFLAGGGLSWIFVAGSLTLTNINTDTLVGWNGNQMLNVIWWELAGVPGLILLAKVFLPLYYKNDCTTVTELLERKYGEPSLRATVAFLFLLGNVVIFLPIMLYTSSLFLISLFGLHVPLMLVATVIAIAGALYAIFGGLRAVAVSDTYSGVLLFGMALLVVALALAAVDWDLSGLPAERLALIGDSSAPVPWHTLLTGMIFTQLYYWSVNQTITQRALAAKSLKEAQRGCYAAAVIRASIVPAIVIIPGLCAYKLYGDIGDATYGRIVSDTLPTWLSGAFAAAMVAATMTSFNSTLNSSAALYVCDLHQRFVNPKVNIGPLSVGVSIFFAILGIALVPAYMGAESIIQLIQQLIGLFSMPILAAFITGLLFKNVHARAVIASLFFGAGLYALLSFGWPAWHAAAPETRPAPWHFLHLMFINLWLCVGFALLLNSLFFKRRPAR